MVKDTIDTSLRILIKLFTKSCKSCYGKKKVTWISFLIVVAGFLAINKTN